jgi:hypothetical protein
MVRVLILYAEAPDPERYERHVELCRREVSEATIRHGRIFGTPQGESDLAHYFEFEFVDRDAFRAAGAGLQRTADDAQSLGVPYRVYFASVE